MEMPALWKEWKAKGRLPTLSTSPLGISPTADEIPTFPQRRFLSLKTKNTKPQNPAAGSAGRHQRKENPGSIHKPVISGSSRIAMNLSFQAHLALESMLNFRLISGLENAARERVTYLQREAGA
ncbi:MAG: hypothetical protein LC130_06440 [Bryobacterales bacterium]|nr:hypothetical protein [Bryobacterales bacterium]